MAVNWHDVCAGDGGRLREYDWHATLSPVLGVEAVARPTVPAKLFTAVTVIVVNPELPQVNETGLVAVMLKSTTWNTIAGVECETVPPAAVTVPVTVTA